MTKTISRRAARLHPIHGDPRHRNPPRLRARRRLQTALPVAHAPLLAAENNVRPFITAFLGGFVFLSVMIF